MKTTQQKIQKSNYAVFSPEELESKLAELLNGENGHSQELLVEIALYLKRKKIEIQNVHDQYGQKIKLLAEVLGIDKTHFNELGIDQMSFLRTEAKKNLENEEEAKRSVAREILTQLEELGNYLESEKRSSKKSFEHFMEQATTKG